MTLVIGALVAVGMVVVVPLGLRLIDNRGGPVAVIAQAWPLAGLAGAASLIVPRMAPATAGAQRRPGLGVRLSPRRYAGQRDRPSSQVHTIVPTRPSWSGSTTSGTSFGEWYPAYGTLPRRAAGMSAFSNDQ